MTALYIQKILRNVELLDHKITKEWVDERVAGAKGGDFTQGLGQENCIYAKEVNHSLILNTNLLNNTKQN